MRFASYLAIASAAVSSVYAGLEDVTSGTKLTASNFDSAISGKGALVAFFAPWCGHCKSLEPTWQKLGQDFADEDGIIIGHLDADNADNRPTASRYGVKGYPTIKWFSADGSAPVDYQGPRTEDAFISFINENAGTHRTAGGLLDSLAGRLPSFDALLGSFLSAPRDARASLVSQAQDLASQATVANNAVNSKAAAYYLKVMDKFSESSDWIQTEVARLQKLAGKRGTMAGKQLEDLQIRQNILSAFEAAKASASSVISDASATIDSATSAAYAAGSSASASASASYVSASGAAGAAAEGAYSAGVSAASAASKSAGSAASVATQSAQSAASAASASLDSASSAAGSAAGGAYAAGESAASDVSKSAGSAANAATQSGQSAASGVSASVVSAASAASASIDSAASAVSGAAATQYSKVVGEL